MAKVLRLGLLSQLASMVSKSVLKSSERPGVVLRPTVKDTYAIDGLEYLLCSVNVESSVYML